MEDRINNYIRYLKNQGIYLYNSLYTSGTHPGLLYGLPKIHKPDIPLRPILSSINTPTYKLSKFLVPLLEPITSNQYTLKDSFDFVNFISNLSFNECYMTSFDIKSLFTNIPVQETINIISERLFTTSTTLIANLNKKQFTKLLQLATSNSIFLFNNELFQQIDGMAMGSPLGPAFANSFLCHHEENWLGDCPPNFKPLVYKRYIDDCFLIFNNQQQSHDFLNYINNKHSNISFTSEGQCNDSLSFLDVSVRHTDGSFVSSVFHKPTSTLLGTNFFSFTPFKFKISGISSKIFRAFNICSSWESFHLELEYILRYTNFNLFPTDILYNLVNKFLNNIFQPLTPIPKVPKLKVYLKIPFLGPQTDALVRQLKPLFNNCFPYVQFIFIPINNLKISSFFRLKDSIPMLLRSSVIYKYTCADCQSRYIGQTGLQMKIRISKHRGVSYRTNLPLTSPENSSIRTHFDDTGHNISQDGFSILGSATDLLDRRIIETLHINSVHPELNTDTSSINLFTQ